MQIEAEGEARLLHSILSCATTLADLDAALHSMDLVNVQGKLAASMASQIILLRDLAVQLRGVDLPEDPAKLLEALQEISSGR